MYPLTGLDGRVAVITGAGRMRPIGRGNCARRITGRTLPTRQTPDLL